MSVDLQPAELGFKRPFTHEVNQVLRLHNPQAESVAFKVKTTAPKQYCVRPNSGRLEPNSTTEVQVLLQAMKEDPPLDTKCRDKFLVQSVVIPNNADPEANVTQIWQLVEATAKGSIQEKKIRVTFLPADGQTNGIAAGEKSHEDLPPAYTAPPVASTSTVTATPSKSASTVEPASPSLIDQSVASVQSAAETVQQSAASAVSAVVAAVPTSTEELKQQLEEAKAQITKLQAQATEGLRQRRIVDSDTETKSSPSLSLQNQPAPGGVSVQIVALLCLLAFLLAYLFF